MPAWFVGFGLEREAVAEAFIRVVFAQEIQRIAEPLGGDDGVFDSVRFRALTPAPHHVGLRAELGSQLHRPHGFLHGVRADLGVVAGEGAVLEDRVAEQIGGGHGHLELVPLECLLEILLDGIDFGVGGVDGKEVVVVEVDAVDVADLAQQVADLSGVECGSGGLAEGVGPGVADGPEAEGELIFLEGVKLSFLDLLLAMAGALVGVRGGVAGRGWIPDASQSLSVGVGGECGVLGGGGQEVGRSALAGGELRPEKKPANPRVGRLCTRLWGRVRGVGVGWIRS